MPARNTRVAGANLAYVTPERRQSSADAAPPSTWHTHYERAPEMPPNCHQQPTIATSSNL